MKVFGICASPRNNTTEYVLKNALDKLESHNFETEIFTCMGKDIKPCMHCDYCLENKKCIIDDDMATVYEGLQSADGIILATPIQSGGISSNLFAVGGDRTGGQDFAHLKNITYFMIHGIIPVSGGPFGSNLGASFWSNDSLDDIKEDSYGMDSLDRTLHEFENFLNKYI